MSISPGFNPGVKVTRISGAASISFAKVMNEVAAQRGILQQLQTIKRFNDK